MPGASEPLVVAGLRLEGEWISSLGPSLICKDAEAVFPSGAAYSINVQGSTCTMDGWLLIPEKSSAKKLCWEKDGVPPIIWSYKREADDNELHRRRSQSPKNEPSSPPAVVEEPSPPLVVHNLTLDGRWQSTIGAALVCRDACVTFDGVEQTFPITVEKGIGGEVCRMDGWSLNWKRSSATTLRWEKRGRESIFWDYLGKVDEVAATGRGRRTHTEHIADSFPLVGQRILIGRGVDGGATGVILEYLTEKIVRLQRDDTDREETMSLEARPFSLIRGGPDLVQMLSEKPSEEHDAIARKFFKEAPRANLDIRDMCFSERLDRLLRDGYAPCAVNLGEKLLHAEKPEVNTDMLSLRIISPKKGRGYAAAKHIPAGTILLREVGLRVPLHNAEALAAAILLACETEPDCVWDKPGLCGACEDMPSVRDSFVPCLIGADAQTPPTLKAWNTAREQVASNFFTSDTPPPSNILQGYGSFFNHSCDPNAAWNHNNMGTFVVRAIKPIKPGEEVCFTYSDEIGTDDSVFKCQCDACARRRKRQRTNRRKAVAQWVQCDQCAKWRKTPYSLDDLKKVPSTWRCIDNPNYNGGGDTAAACAEPVEDVDDEEELDENDRTELISSDDEGNDGDEQAAKRRKRGNLEGLSIEGPGGISLETEIIIAPPGPSEPPPKKKASGRPTKEQSSKQATRMLKPPSVAKTAAEWKFDRNPPVLLPQGACVPLVKLSDVSVQLSLWESVCGTRDEHGRLRAESFMRVPERVELPKLPPFPKPSPVPPTIKSGQKSVLVNGKLPNMAKHLPSEEELQSWDCESQQAFWAQRKRYWGSGKGSGGTGWSGWKLGDLQRECRKRGIFPGGDIGFVRNRLLRHDFCPSQLLASETQTEAESIEAQMQPGVVYYKIVTSPIDLTMIKHKIEQRKYATDSAQLEQDFLQVFANGRRFDVEINAPEDNTMTQDADALQAVLKDTIRQIKLDEARTAKANKLCVQAAVRAAATYACREVRRWESRAGTALAKRKRTSTKGLHATDDAGDEWEVVIGANRGNGENTVVLRKLRQSQAVDEDDA